MKEQLLFPKVVSTISGTHLGLALAFSSWWRVFYTEVMICYCGNGCEWWQAKNKVPKYWLACLCSWWARVEQYNYSSEPRRFLFSWWVHFLVIQPLQIGHTLCQHSNSSVVRSSYKTNSQDSIYYTLELVQRVNTQSAYERAGFLGYEQSPSELGTSILWDAWSGAWKQPFFLHNLVGWLNKDRYCTTSSHRRD
jgi:hypothetical protein